MHLYSMRLALVNVLLKLLQDPGGSTVGLELYGASNNNVQAGIVYVCLC